jgi:hypothetical protein
MRTLVSRLVPVGAALVAGAALLLLCDAALGQQATGPPKPDLRGGPPQWVGFVFIFLLLAAVMAVSLMPAKRGHQD